MCSATFWSCVWPGILLFLLARMSFVSSPLPLHVHTHAILPRTTMIQQSISVLWPSVHQIGRSKSPFLDALSQFLWQNARGTPPSCFQWQSCDLALASTLISNLLNLPGGRSAGLSLVRWYIVASVVVSRSATLKYWELQTFWNLPASIIFPHDIEFLPLVSVINRATKWTPR